MKIFILLSESRLKVRKIAVYHFLRGGGGGGGRFHSNLGCCDTFLKIVSLLENYRSEWGKSIHFWKALCTGFSKIPNSLS